MVTRRTVLIGISAGAAAMLPQQSFAHDGVHIYDAWARFIPGSPVGAAYFRIENHANVDEHLMSAFSRIADKVEVHATMKSDDGMVSMKAMHEGIMIPPMGEVSLEPGGSHLMFMGVTEMPKDGETVPVTLVFHHAGEVTLDIPVDNKR